MNYNYLAPPAPEHEQLSRNVTMTTSSRVSSRSASPCRRGRGQRERANSLTPTQDDEVSPLSKLPPRPTTQLNEIFRPRCNTDPSRSPTHNGKKAATRSVLGSLLRQTLKVTSASVGFSASEER
ncbi:hypothetical protein KR093_004136 [Drosophila rubida]|uniref:Uncharacterized protein n=1 Tax=Drosophila rubida TaxID=30044 RepID=A0AAD4K9Y9_9MUSC|nr:hypothetical protein KR093_004136 [Drosophila rubida]